LNSINTREIEQSQTLHNHNIKWIKSLYFHPLDEIKFGKSCRPHS
jgi:hypothetical protein